MSRAARVAIATVALGGDFPLKAARMIQEFHKHSPGFEIQAWVNILPDDCPTDEDLGGHYEATSPARMSLQSYRPAT